MHGGVGCSDAEKIFLTKGFEPVSFPYHHDFSVRAKVNRLIFLVKIFLRVEKGATVVFIHPVYAGMVKLLVRLLLIRKNVKIVCFIVDIDGIKDGNSMLLGKEISFFRKIKYFILLNEKMGLWLRSKVPGIVFSKIDFHSFLAEPVLLAREKSFNIVFAGNLAKSHFLDQLHLLRNNRYSLHFNLYGPGQGENMTKQANVTYYGVEKPYDLPGKLQGSFGLLWDGDSIDGPAGSLGDYMQYISHHKLSLYILSNLPLIVPATAASAILVEKYNIGFAVNSLYEIEEKIKNLSQAEYRQMQINMQPLAEKISKGEFLAEAMDEIMREEF